MRRRRQDDLLLARPALARQWLQRGELVPALGKGCTPLAQAPTAYHLQPGAGAATPAAEAFAAWLKGVGERAAGEGLALV